MCHKFNEIQQTTRHRESFAEVYSTASSLSGRGLNKVYVKNFPCFVNSPHLFHLFLKVFVGQLPVFLC